jgi:hypothetical protein
MEQTRAERPILAHHTQQIRISDGTIPQVEATDQAAHARRTPFVVVASRANASYESPTPSQTARTLADSLPGHRTPREALSAAHHGFAHCATASRWPPSPSHTARRPRTNLRRLRTPPEVVGGPSHTSAHLAKPWAAPATRAHTARRPGRPQRHDHAPREALRRTVTPHKPASLRGAERGPREARRVGSFMRVDRAAGQRPRAHKKRASANKG